jgi:serine/threonine-protein kinase
VRTIGRGVTPHGIPAPGDIVDGKYRIERELGRGGMAIVLAATQLLARREVAMKWLQPAIARSPEIVARFLREAQAAARIEHPNVVQVLDVGRSGDGFYLVMEMLSGENLRERLNRLGPLPVPEALSIACAVLGALHAAHQAGVVHRDIKPENVFLRLDERGRPRGVKVLDFGISKLSESESLTLTGQHFGTAYYLAPEQAAGKDASSPRIDVYQFGVMLYELLTAKRPYEGDTYAAVLVALMTTEHVPLAKLRPDLPPGLAHAVDRAMTRDPARRPADALALAKLFAAVPGARFDEVLERAIAEEAGTAPAMAAVSIDQVTAPIAATRAAQPVAAAPSAPIPPTSTDPVSPVATAPMNTPGRPGWGLVLGGGIVVAGLAAGATLAALRFFATGPSPVPHAAAPTSMAASSPIDTAQADAGIAVGIDVPTTPPPSAVPPTTASPASEAPPASDTPPASEATSTHHHHPHVSADEF